MNNSVLELPNFARQFRLKKSTMRFLTTISLLFLGTFAFAQNATIKGTVTSATDKEGLIGATVTYGEGKGTTTDLDGSYSISVEAGEYTLVFSYIGYNTVNKTITIAAGEEKTLNISLQESATTLDDIVISSSVFEKKASEEVISIQVIKPDFIDKINPIRFDDIARRVTGLNVVDGQANIRAGSGWAYGVGSRVMVVMDGQPLLTPDRSDVRWNHLPTEMIGQVEVLKGASSVLYGSSAMNGTINIQSIKPTKTPYNKLISYAGFIGDPAREETKWWRAPRLTTGASFVRAYKPRDNFEYIVGAAMYNSMLQYQGGEDKLARISVQTKWNRNESTIWGIRGTLSYSYETEFFYWQDSEGGALRPAEGVTNNFEAIKLNVDPYFIRYGKRGIRHEVKNRIYVTRPEFADKPYYMINNEYQISKKWDSQWSLVGGVSSQTLAITESAYGGAISANIVAGYLQAEKRWERFTVVAGSRFEGFRFDNIWGAAVAPVKDKAGKTKFVSPGNWRFGANYRVGKQSFLRFNFGQAFRFPSLAERYAEENIGVVNVYRNPDLKPEYGWTSELGFEQKFTTKSKVFDGSFDAAFYWQEYNDLVEFLFDIYVPDSVANSGENYNPLDYGGFKSVNVSQARIAGYELTFKGNININSHVISFMAGYNYAYPTDLNTDTTGKLSNFGPYIKNLFKSNFVTAKKIDTELTDALLKYRNRHLLTVDLEWKFKGISVGADLRYYSFVEKVDDVFGLIVPNILDYRIEEDFKGNFVAGFRAFYQINKKNNIGVIVRNLTNTEYYLRPPKIESPRSYLLQYRYEF